MVYIFIFFCSINILNFDNVEFTSFFLLWIILLVSYLRHLCLTESHEDFLLCFSESFIVLPFTFRPRIYVGLIFVYGVWYAFRFIFLDIDTQLSQYHLLKRISFPFWIPLKPHVLPVILSNSYYKQSCVIIESWTFPWPESISFPEVHF